MQSNKPKALSSSIVWKTVGNKKYLLFDLQYCSDEERIHRSNLILPIIFNEELKSLNLLIDVRNTTVTIESMRAVSNGWIAAVPHFNKVAICGVYGYKAVLFKLIKHLTSMKSKPFKTKEEAVDFILSS